MDAEKVMGVVFGEGDAQATVRYRLVSTIMGHGGHFTAAAMGTGDKVVTFESIGSASSNKTYKYGGKAFCAKAHVWLFTRVAES